MKSPPFGSFALTAAAAFGTVLGLAIDSHRATSLRAERVKSILHATLPDVPGKAMTAVVVDYAPGGVSLPHYHGGSVLAVVLSGTIRSENSATGPARVYRTGEAFFEPAGSVHRISANASATESARLLAVFVAPDDAKLTTTETGP